MLQAGQLVRVNLAGLQAGGVMFQASVTDAVGHIVKQTSELPPWYLVKLLFSFGGLTEVEVPAERIHADRYGIKKMPLANQTKMEQLRSLFESREAIYVEKGALRVKVTDIRGDVARQYVSAEVEEVPTTGLPVGAIHAIKQHEPSPLRWSIEGGYLTGFSDHTWHMGYGGWSLFFTPSIVEDIRNLALRFPDNLDPFQRYNSVLDYLQGHRAYEPTQRLFEER